MDLRLMRRLALATTALVALPAMAAAQATVTPPSVPVSPLAVMKLGSDGEIYIPFGSSYLGVVNRAGDTMTGDLLSTATFQTKTNPTCHTTDGGWVSGLATWLPTCFGVWIANNSGGMTIYPTRGTTSSNGVYPPSTGFGTPVGSTTAQLLVQAQANGANGLNPNGIFINFDSVGGAYSQANPPGSPNNTNTTAMLISVHQRPDAAGNIPISTWAFNTDFVRSAGSGLSQSYGFENDLNNFDCNSSIGSSTCGPIAWYFYGGIAAHPGLAFHYIANPATTSYSGTVTSAGNTFTLVTGSINAEMTTLTFAGTTYRVSCNRTSCTTDAPLATVTTPGAFSGFSSMAHEGIFFQDGPAGDVVQDNDILAADSAHTVITALGRHAVGLDFTQDAMPNAAFFAAGQNVCHNGPAACMSYSTGLNAFLFQPNTAQSSYVASIDLSGNGVFNGTLRASGYGVGAAAGVSCSGTPSSSYAVNNGIVTHC